MKLSILIPSTHNRYNNFLINISKTLYAQLNDSNRGDVEILTFIDNKERMLGTKRNNLINIANGEYVVFVDDDDRVTEDYISSILEVIRSNENYDVICFQVSVSLNKGPSKLCHYSKEYGKDFNTEDAYYRLPNHIMCYKKSLMEQVPFRDITNGEDSDFSKRAFNLIKREYQINKVLYYYDFDINTTETQELIVRKR